MGTRTSRSIRPLLLILIGGLALFGRPLSAGPPFFTDDCITLLVRQWEVFLASQHDWTTDVRAGTAPHFELNYGASSQIMLHIIFPMNYAQPSGHGIRYGLGDVEIGCIYQFIKEDKSRPMIGTFPHLEIPSGSRRRGLGNGRPQVFIPIWVCKNLGRWMTYGGGGYWINPGPANKNNWAYGAVVQRELSKVVSVGGEIFGNTTSTVGESGRTAVNLGAIITLRQDHDIMLSLGRDIHGPDDFYMYLAYHFTISGGD